MLLNRQKTSRLACFPFVLVLLAGSCAGIAPPSAKMANLTYALNEARMAEANDYAPLELQLAQDKYEAAKKAIAEKNYARAGRLIDQAMLDAELAREKALSAREKKNAYDLRQSINALREKTERMKPFHGE